MQSSGVRDFDILFLGAGLSSCLAAARIQGLFPSMRVGIADAGTQIGNHGNTARTWSFHVSDVCREADFESHWLFPFVSKIWNGGGGDARYGYEVKFPKLSRVLPFAYAACSSEEFHTKFLRFFRGKIIWNNRVELATSQSVKLSDGAIVTAHCVLDGRGTDLTDNWPCGYQKFVGAFFRTAKPHGIVRPVIMDATVAQLDGFRFFYTLPFDANHVLVEDTYYSSNPKLDEAGLRSEVLNHLKTIGIRVAEALRFERGVLPIPQHSAGEYLALCTEAPAPIGMRGGFFHPVTGYSLVSAVKVADSIAEYVKGARAESLKALTPYVKEMAQKHWSQGTFLRRLNNMFFLAGRPEERYKVIQKFYKHQSGLISRFYGNRLTPLDRALLVMGKPPVPVLPAVRSFVTAQPKVTVLSKEI